MIGAEKSVPITIAAETRSVHTLSRQEEIRLEFTGRMDRWVDRGKDGWMDGWMDGLPDNQMHSLQHRGRLGMNQGEEQSLTKGDSFLPPATYSPGKDRVDIGNDLNMA